MRTGERTQIIGQREGHQEVGTGEQVSPLFVQPTIRLELVTLRAGAIAAGVIREQLLRTVIALMDVASKERRAAGSDIAQSPYLTRAQAAAGLLNVRR